MNKEPQIDVIKQKLKSLKSSFLIQAGHPKAEYLKQNQFDKASEVFPKLFSENAERAILLWNEIPVLLSYDYAWYSNYDHFIDWLQKMTFQNTAKYEFTMMTNDFLVEIETDWKDDVLTMKSNWKAKRSHWAMAELLNEKGMIRMNRVAFLKEWKILLHQITNAFKVAKVVLNDSAETTKFSNIYKIMAKIEGQGKRYTQ